MKIIAALAVFCVLIITHELGHFVVAKMSGIYVYSFNLGMGPKLFSFTKGETEYTIRLLPLGGSVMMMGEDDDTCDDDPRSFNRQAVWKRICTIAAGPLMNFVTAIVLFIIVFMMLGTASDANIIGGVIEGSAAEAAGLQAGDQILYIGDYLIEKWNDISPAIAAAGAGNPLDIVFLRDGVQQQLTLQPYFDEASGNWMIGIQSSVARQSLSTAIKLGFMQTYRVGEIHQSAFGGFAFGLVVFVQIGIGTQSHGGSYQFSRTNMVNYGHFVLGQSTGFIGADHLSAAQSLHSRQPTDDCVTLGHFGNTDGQHHSNHRSQALGNGGNCQRNGNHEGLQNHLQGMALLGQLLPGDEQVKSKDKKTDTQH